MMRSIIVSSFVVLAVFMVPAKIWSQNGTATGNQLSQYKVTASHFGVGHFQGIQPLKVTVALLPPKAAASDQKFLAKVKTYTSFGFSSVTTGILKIPTGNTSGSIDLMLPASGFIQSGTLEIQKVDARGKRNSIHIRSGDLQIGTYNSRLENRGPRMLLIGKTNTPEFGNYQLVDNRKVWVTNGMFSNGDFSVSNVSVTQPQLIVKGPAVSWKNARGSFGERLASIKVGNLPERWIGLSGFDQILISSDEFRGLVENNEIQRSNLEKWVAAGGALVIYSCGPDYRETNNLFSLFLGESRASKLASGEFRWGVPLNVPTKTKVHCAVRSGVLNVSGEKVLPFNTSLAVKQVDNPSLIDSGEFGFLPYLNGCIISVDDDMTNWTSVDWRRLENSIVLNGSSLAARIGVSTGIFPVLTIPGVGEPPKMLFKILLSMFLLIAGPVALTVFSKIGKPQLLLIVIPLLSVGVSLSLIAFVLLSDGFSKTASVRSVTTLDQRTDLAVIDSKVAYFSNFTSQGYSFSPDTLIGLTCRQRGLVRNIDQTEGQSRIYGKALLARTLHELSTFQARSVSEGLVFKLERADDSSLPTARNDLGAKVVFAIFRDKHDDYYLLENLESGLTKKLEKIELGVGDRLLNYAGELIIKDNGKEFSQNAVGFGDNEAVFETAKLSGLLSRPNSYVAFLEELPFVTDELDTVNYKSQNHVVLGRW